MVNGVKMVFKKELALKHLKDAGLMDRISPDDLSLMDNLDGQEVSTSSWARQVYGAPVYACEGKDGKFYDVCEVDCVAL